MSSDKVQEIKSQAAAMEKQLMAKAEAKEKLTKKRTTLIEKIAAAQVELNEVNTKLVDFVTAEDVTEGGKILLATLKAEAGKSFASTDLTALMPVGITVGKAAATNPHIVSNGKRGRGCTYSYVENLPTAETPVEPTIANTVETPVETVVAPVEAVETAPAPVAEAA